MTPGTTSEHRAAVLKRLERVRSMQLGLFAGAATLAVGVQSDRYFILRQRYPARAAKPEPSSIIEDGSGRGLGPTPKVPVPPVGTGGLPDCVMVAVIVCYLRQSPSDYTFRPVRR